VATYKEDLSPEEMQKGVEAMCTAKKETFFGVDSAERRSTDV
jgi:hypothetical protein